MAVKLNVSRQTVGKWETDIMLPTKENINTLNSVLDCNLYDVFFQTQDKDASRGDAAITVDNDKTAQNEMIRNGDIKKGKPFLALFIINAFLLIFAIMATIIAKKLAFIKNTGDEVTRTLYVDKSVFLYAVGFNGGFVCFRRFLIDKIDKITKKIKMQTKSLQNANKKVVDISL